MRPTKFSEDIVPLSAMKANPGKVVHQVDETRRPVLLTSRGRGVAVVQALADFEAESRSASSCAMSSKGSWISRRGARRILPRSRQRLGLT